MNNAFDNILFLLKKIWGKIESVFWSINSRSNTFFTTKNLYSIYHTVLVLPTGIEPASTDRKSVILSH